MPNYSGSGSGSSNGGSQSSADVSSAAPSPTPTNGNSGNSGNSGNNGNQHTTARPSVITSIAPGETIVKTVPAVQASSTSDSANQSQGGGGTNVGAIAAGVVVGVLAIAAIAGGLFWFIRRKKRQAAEDEYKRSNQVSDFMRGGNERKPPQTGYSQMSDSRLDPEAGQRRDSQGSIADNQDYSRRILRVSIPTLSCGHCIASLGLTHRRWPTPTATSSLRFPPRPYTSAHSSYLPTSPFFCA